MSMPPYDLPDHIGPLLERYCAGELSIDEQHALVAELAELGVWPDPRGMLQKIRLGLTDAALHTLPDNPEHAYARLKARIAQTERAALLAAELPDRTAFGQGPRAASAGRQSLSRTVARYVTHHAAAFAVGTAAFVAVGVMATRTSVRGGLFGTSVTYVTHAAQRRELDLADGTHVSLNVASQLSIPPGFNAGHRTVRLRGEALFNVTHAVGTPFTVEAAHTTTRALGTEFAVRAYDSADVRVVVRTGRVAFDHAVLGRNDVAHLQHRVLVVEQKPSVDPFLAFAHGRLVLDNVPLANAIPELNRWYGTDIQLGDRALADVHVSMICPEDTLPGLVAQLTGMAKRSDSLARRRTLDTLLAAIDEANARYRAVLQSSSSAVPQAKNLSEQEARQLLQGASRREHTTPLRPGQLFVPRDTSNAW